MKSQNRQTNETGNKWLLGGIVGIGALTALTVWSRQRRQDFRGKVVVITGGSRGLGLVLARQFADAGAKLAICARDADELNRAEISLEKRQAEVFAKTCDVRNQDDVNEFINSVINHFGRVDVLVNNAGVIQVAPLENQTAKDFEEAMSVHFWGAFHTMQAVVPLMKKQGAGRIVNIASIGGKVAIPHLAPYCASKFALVGLSDAMRHELRKDNIFVTTVCPGLMRTGSHVNATFKGQNELEYAWFSLGDATPLTSISAESAAKQILEAARRGRAELIISFQAEILAKMNALFPELTAEIMGLADRFLPAAGGIGDNYATGLESGSFVSPSFVTSGIDAAARANNELAPDEQLSEKKNTN
ncbi:MAG: SDR family oxidoreductase [Acidobacteriota bacterium]|nr:SDR family oxidoreductase [Acidobacteriota bacterium]